jgi:Flp pilus assembly pilin Flp
MKIWTSRRSSERGATAVEYAIVLAGTAAVFVAGINLFGDAVADFFDSINAALF